MDGDQEIMTKVYNPTTIAGPFGHYDHGVEVVGGQRILQVSGQVGTAPDGTTPEGIEAQTEQVWQNLEAILAEAGMSANNIVKTTTYLLDRNHVPVLGAARKRHLGEGHKAASTTVMISGLVRAEWLVEIDVMAIA